MPSKEQSFSIIAVGTELTTGQITNRNAAWLSEQLSQLGWDVILHLTVADDTEAMISSFEYAASRSANLIVTGGLGPTTDDFTRNAVCAWSQKELAFDEPSWERIVSRMKEFDLPINLSNKQQCYFPAGAKILTNGAGTANAFYLEHQGCKLWCLPGPPSEVNRVWHDHMLSPLTKAEANQDRVHLQSWYLLGQAESAIGELVEEIVSGTQLKTGYRATFPYLEVKIWSPENPSLADNEALQKIDKELQASCVDKNHTDLPGDIDRLILQYQHIKISDGITKGLILKRLSSPWSRLEGVHARKTSYAYHDWTLDHDDELILSISPLQDNKWQVGITDTHRNFAKEATMPSRYLRYDAQKLQSYVAEVSLKIWRELLQTKKDPRS